jgi:hypothetical protein
VSFKAEMLKQAGESSGDTVDLREEVFCRLVSRASRGWGSGRKLTGYDDDSQTHPPSPSCQPSFPPVPLLG